ncbi:SDR family oxidoreductase [Specibacter cremeus]|uniref:SDR family oxidoreductase n=1 Tax=Specibacter cremeus TaxID=1629051 RepID=UPI000F7BAA03|nr:SDR family oxidoreductase [Specibacter cremeus]
MNKIVIIGGHGRVGMLLSRLLVEEGWQVTSVIRTPDQYDDVAAAGAEPLVLDVEMADADSLVAALAGHEAVVWSAGAGGGNPARTYAVDRDAAIRSMDAAEQAGVRRYLMVSYLGAGPDHGIDPSNSFFPYAEAKADADENLRNTSLDWTILAPGALTDGPPSGTITTAPDRAHRQTNRGNVARVAAAVLATPATIHRTIEFTDGAMPIAEAIGGLTSTAGA